MKTRKILLLLAIFLMPLFIAANDSSATASSIIQNEINSENARMKIFPNPVKENKFRVQSSDPIKEIHLHNIAGQESRIQLQRNSESDVQVRLTDKKPGIYLVTVIFENKPKQVKRIVVN